MAADQSIVEYFAEHEKYRCGYCKSEDTNFSHGMWAHRMTVQDYQDLIDRGWRRSGKYVYKPTMNQTCCPQYTIRCEALNFKLSKSQKKALRQVHKYLNSATTGDDTSNTGQVTPPGGEVNKHKTGLSADAKRADKMDCDTVKGPAQHSASGNSGSGLEDSDVKKKKTPTPGTGADPNKPKCKKAKQLRLERKQQKNEQPVGSSNKPPFSTASACTQKKAQENQPKSIEDFLADISENPAHRLEVKLVRSAPRSTEFESSFDASYALFKKYQMTIHKEPPDECDEQQFVSFLVASPLEEEYTDGGFSEGLGSFHQQYWLDGRLIAVGVLDILPTCTSSVYLYYDPDYSFLSPGTYSALREVAFTRWLHQKQASIKYYYMGFYIHTCPKMRYKGKYDPSFLLCPEVYSWHPIEECSPKLDVTNYSRFAPPDKVDPNADIEVKSIPVLYKHTLMPYFFYQLRKPEADDEEDVKEYGELVGNTCAQRIILFRS